jgi:hypothetical protein
MDKGSKERTARHGCNIERFRRFDEARSGERLEQAGRDRAKEN